MSENNRHPPSDSSAGGSENADQGSALNPELVRQVADKVYALFLDDLRIERERRRLERIGSDEVQGGGIHGLIW